MDIILLKLSCTMKMKRLKKQNEGKFMSRKNSVNTMKNKIKEMYDFFSGSDICFIIGCVIAGVAIYFDYKLLGVIGLCILLLARVTG